jgi:hypothetical protein
VLDAGSGFATALAVPMNHRIARNTESRVAMPSRHITTLCVSGGAMHEQTRARDLTVASAVDATVRTAVAVIASKRRTFMLRRRRTWAEITAHKPSCVASLESRDREPGAADFSLCLVYRSFGDK